MITSVAGLPSIMAGVSPTWVGALPDTWRITRSSPITSVNTGIDARMRAARSSATGGARERRDHRDLLHPAHGPIVEGTAAPRRVSTRTGPRVGQAGPSGSVRQTSAMFEAVTRMRFDGAPSPASHPCARSSPSSAASASARSRSSSSVWTRSWKRNENAASERS